MAKPSRFVSAWIVALAIGAVACGIFAAALSKAGAAEPPQIIVFCGEAKAMAATLAKKFGEEPVGRGQISPEALIVVYARPDGQSFTVLRVMASGKACVVTSGLGWEALAAKLGEAL
ncbi:hypothetical protein [Mesorhizobium sp. KR9-304]|uniref:hypothetical protein n=1 Tax=Mesorhizobium sp. KR9-304 TaxID=3156614 RepID=UPI0032B44D7C